MDCITPCAETGKRRCDVFFSGEMHEAELYNIQLHEHLHDAIQQHEFHLMLQPIVDLQDQKRFSGRRMFASLVLRNGRRNSSRSFPPPAEESGLIIPLGRWIIEQACRELSAMILRGAPANFILHINVSAIQLLQQDFCPAFNGCNLSSWAGRGQYLS